MSMIYGSQPGIPNDQSPETPFPDNSIPWAFPDHEHGVYTWYGPGGPGNAGNDGSSSGSGGSRGKRGGRGRKGRTPKAVRLHPANQTARAGVATQAYPTASQATGGAIPILEVDALAEVGLTAVLAELVNHGNVTLAHTLQAWQREQDRITNRTWRRPGGLARPAGL